MRSLSLCSGYGGLSLAVEAAFAADTVAFAEVEPSAAAIFARHWPDAEPLGDLTAVDWTRWIGVDVVEAGFPCQDLSYAGKGAGIKEGNRSGLWYAIEDALGVLRPRYVVLENVAAIVGRRPGLDVVLAGLARLGFDAEWACLRASDVGAPHRRERWFCVATDSTGSRQGDDRRLLLGNSSSYVDGGVGDRTAARRTATDAESVGRAEGRSEPDRGRAATGGAAAQDAYVEPGDQRGQSAPGQAQGGRTRADARRRGGTPPADPGGERHGGGQDGGGVGRLDGQDAGEARQRERSRQESGDRGATTPADATGVCRPGEPIQLDEGRPLVSAQPRPSGGDGPGGSPEGVRELGGSAGLAWGDYGPAIARWEHTIGRPAPPPTDDKGRLAPRFVEWMQGLPDGWVTDTPGLSRNQMLKALGNGVVPQQAYTAVTTLLVGREVSAA